MNEVYVVTEGSYSDYRIVAVFTDRAKAEKLAGMGRDMQFETWPVDPDMPQIPEGYQPWIITMERNGDTGNCYEVHILDFVHGRLVLRQDYRYEIVKDNRYPPEQSYVPKTRPLPPVLIMRLNVLARDKQHAVKIANEKRVQLIAEGKFVEGYREEGRNIFPAHTPSG